MAHASRTRVGQTIPVKQQKKSVPVQTVKKPTNYTQAAVYTASGAKNTKSTAATYTAKATYADPALAKKQSVYIDIAKSNQEAAKVSSDVLSKAKNFWNGIVEAGKSTIESVKDMVRHPVQMGKDLVYAAAHPKETAEGLKVMAAEVWQKYQTGNGDTKSHITGRVTGEIGLLFVGGWSKTGKVAKTSKAAEAVKAAEVVKAVDVAGDLVKGAKVAGNVVGTVGKIEDKIDIIKWNNYYKEMEDITGYSIRTTQKELVYQELTKDLHTSKLTGQAYKGHRKMFREVKDDLIRQWEKETKQVWPTHTADVLDKNGKVYIKAGTKYDVHEIIPNVYNSPLEWWNIHPAMRPIQHQGGIHGAGAAIKEIFK